MNNTQIQNNRIIVFIKGSSERQKIHRVQEISHFSFSTSVIHPIDHGKPS